jgi:hypothetical protein
MTWRRTEKERRREGGEDSTMCMIESGSSSMWKIPPRLTSEDGAPISFLRIGDPKVTFANGAEAGSCSGKRVQ